jgi:hypothetical protein
MRRRIETIGKITRVDPTGRRVMTPPIAGELVYVSLHGKVDRVEPPVGYTTRSLEVRPRFRTENPNLSQSLFAHVAILGLSRHNLLMVPRDAVIEGAAMRVRPKAMTAAVMVAGPMPGILSGSAGSEAMHRIAAP